MCLKLEWNHTHVENQPGTVEKNSSSPPAGMEPMPLRCQYNALITELRR